MEFVRARRLEELPPYLFGEIDRKKRAALEAGKDIIDFGVGDPDQPTPDFIIEALRKTVGDSRHHRYPQGQGSPTFRQAVADWFSRRFGVTLDPADEVLMLIGSKEGLAHLPLACLNPGDVALVPSLGYPVYRSATTFAGGRPLELSLSAETGWLPNLDTVPTEQAETAKLLFLNYPNNPTGAAATLEFLEHAVAFARKHNVLIAQDAAYCEIFFDEPPPSIMQIDGGKESAVEFFSLSKTFNMTGWRIGFAVGRPDALAALAKIKANTDSGQFGAIQAAAIEALNHYDHADVRASVNRYRERRDVLVDGLNKLGWSVAKPSATFYVWTPVPGGGDAVDFASRVLAEADVVIVPGSGFGRPGERYVRFALTVPTERIHEALERMSRMNFGT